jgi:hypothetical protein
MNEMNCEKTKRSLKLKRKKSAANIIHVSLLRENLRANENIAKENRNVGKERRQKDDNLQKIFVLFKLHGNL